MVYANYWLSAYVTLCFSVGVAFYLAAIESVKSCRGAFYLPSKEYVGLGRTSKK